MEDSELNRNTRPCCCVRRPIQAVLLAGLFLAGLSLVFVDMSAMAKDSYLDFGEMITKSRIQGNSLWENAGNYTFFPANSSVSIELESSKTSVPLQSQPATSKTKIIAVADVNYKDVVALWYHQLAKLGYTTHQIVCTDEECHAHFEDQGMRVDTLMHTNSSNWPLHKGRMQQYRRRVFATRWVYVLRQLERGHHVLLTDADNIFVTYKSMESLEESSIDVYHAYGGGFPVRFTEMGFTVCGGMEWIRSCPGTIQWVKLFLKQCGWDGSDQAQCDDQQVINLLLFTNMLNMTWTHNTPAIVNASRTWKPRMAGTSRLTGHRLEIWDVNEAYRGSVCGENGTCPKNPWVSMPTNSLSAVKGMSTSEEKLARVKDFYECCIYKNYTGNGG
jgi:hypothetical protein